MVSILAEWLHVRIFIKSPFNKSFRLAQHTFPVLVNVMRIFILCVLNWLSFALGLKYHQRDNFT